MEQRVDQLSAEDLARVDAQRRWVRDHFTPEARHKYDQQPEKLRLLQAILDAGWIDPSETYKLQCLGITFGDALAQELKLEWVVVEDDKGRDPALRFPGTTVIVFPLTMISKRIEAGETVSVSALFEKVVAGIRDMARNRDYQLQ